MTYEIEIKSEVGEMTRLLNLIVIGIIMINCISEMLF